MKMLTSNGAALHLNLNESMCTKLVTSVGKTGITIPFLPPKRLQLSQ
jgi:hypothetical protein